MKNYLVFAAFFFVVFIVKAQSDSLRVGSFGSKFCIVNFPNYSSSEFLTFARNPSNLDQNWNELYQFGWKNSDKFRGQNGGGFLSAFVSFDKRKANCLVEHRAILQVGFNRQDHRYEKEDSISLSYAFSRGLVLIGDFYRIAMPFGKRWELYSGINVDIGMSFASKIKMHISNQNNPMAESFYDEEKTKSSILLMVRAPIGIEFTFQGCMGVFIEKSFLYANSEYVFGVKTSAIASYGEGLSVIGLRYKFVN